MDGDLVESINGEVGIQTRQDLLWQDQFTATWQGTLKAHDRLDLWHYPALVGHRRSGIGKTPRLSSKEGTAGFPSETI
jgi:hypothetical protein